MVAWAVALGKWSTHLAAMSHILRNWLHIYVGTVPNVIGYSGA